MQEKLARMLGNVQVRVISRVEVRKHAGNARYHAERCAVMACLEVAGNKGSLLQLHSCHRCLYTHAYTRIEMPLHQQPFIPWALQDPATSVSLLK